MISNPGVIRDNVLKNILIEQISKVTHMIHYVPTIFEQISHLSQQIPIQENSLEQLKQKTLLRQQQVARQKQALKQQLKAKMFVKMTQQEAISADMKMLQNNCHFIREQRLKLSEIRTRQNRLKNELEQLQVNEREAEQEAERLELKSIYDNKILNSESQRVKQLLMLIEAKRNEIAKERKLMAIVDEQLDGKQKQVSVIKQEANDIQVSIARMMPTIEALTLEKSKYQAQASQLKQRLSSLTAQTLEMTSKTNQNRIVSEKNQHKVTETSKRIQQLIQQSNELNQKVIMTRQHVISLNTLKNKQKTFNQQLKLKVRQLMKIAVENQCSSNEE